MEDPMLESQISCHVLLCFFPTQANLKLANGDMGHTQGIDIISFHFITCYILYPVGPVYYCPGQPSNNISYDAFKCYVGF